MDFLNWFFSFMRHKKTCSFKGCVEIHCQCHLWLSKHKIYLPTVQCMTVQVYIIQYRTRTSIRGNVGYEEQNLGLFYGVNSNNGD